MKLKTILWMLVVFVVGVTGVMVWRHRTERVGAQPAAARICPADCSCDPRTFQVAVTCPGIPEFFASADANAANTANNIVAARILVERERVAKPCPAQEVYEKDGRIPVCVNGKIEWVGIYPPSEDIVIKHNQFFGNPPPVKAVTKKVERATAKLPAAISKAEFTSVCNDQVERALEAAKRFCRAWKGAMANTDRLLVLTGQAPVGDGGEDCEFGKRPQEPKP